MVEEEGPTPELDLVGTVVPAVELDTPEIRAPVCLVKVSQAVHLAQFLNSPSIMAVVAAVVAELRTVPESAVWASLVPFPDWPPITPAVVQRARMTQCLWQADLGEEVSAVRD